MNKAIPTPHASIKAAPDQDRFVQLVGRLTHDLRAPVRAMVELSQWIQEEVEDTNHPKSQDLTTYVTLLKQRGARLEDLISNLAILAQVGLDPNEFDGDWDAVLNLTVQRVPRLKFFDLGTDHSCSPSMARGDLLALLGALLSNAAKHHHKDRGRIDLIARGDDDGCEVCVEDDGPGIAIADRTRAVDMFTTLSSQTAVEGSGLGLAIVKHITDHYNGRLRIEDSSSGQGCRVSVWLPASGTV